MTELERLEKLEFITSYENHAFLVKQDEKIETNPADLKSADKVKLEDYLANAWYNEADTIYANEILVKWNALPQA